MTVLINQLLQLLVGGALGILGVKLCTLVFGKAKKPTDDTSVMNLVIAILAGYLGSNIGNLVTGAEKMNLGVTSLGNMFGCGYSLLPSVIGAIVFSFFIGFILKKVA
ncbi:MAG: hypothetical protein LBM27_06645 [Lactobacillaceae bacterium]|jgi:uncharacterized membrane protein YeaQ/YmgE (transglycosylase-associated protein family)|nr:hypothetical protein [Lactobacillaceae bacterium]